MTCKVYLTSVIFLFLCTTGITQTFEFGQVSMAELKMEEDSLFPQADAIVLDRYVYAKVGQSIEVYEKIKILTKEGLSYATIDIPYYNAFGIKGNTFNLVKGLIQKDELTKEMIFTDKIKNSDRVLTDKKVAFPNVRVGSVIEIYYVTSTGSTADINLQYSIPIKKINVEIFNASGSTYRFVQNPRAYLKVTRKETKKKVFISSVNVPPLEYESFVYDIELYRAKLFMKRLGYVALFDEWKDIPRLLFKEDEFKYEIRPKGIFKDEVSKLIEDTHEPLERVKLIYSYLKDNIVWNGDFGIYPDNGTKSTFKQKKGDVSDINMLFVSMLRSIDIESYPILASSKMNGIHLTASREAFNYTLTGVKISNKWYVLDAANPKATFDYIPSYMINWRGMILKDQDNFEWIDLSSTKTSQNNIIANIQLSEDFVLSGTIKERKTGYFGIDIRDQIKDTNIEKDSLLGINKARLELRNIDFSLVENSENVDVSYDFYFEDAIEEIADQLYLSPLFFLSTSENPFKKSTRKYPIDFGYPFASQYNITIKIPKGYEPISIPKPIQVAMPNNYGTYFYRISRQGGNLQVIVKFKVNEPIIHIEYYEELKEFFKLRINKENEKVILGKVN
ncbi:transglutaminase domain-containing protein [Pontimicrobium sp. SW4]|uniref:Transglutaminase domain-containing protein n=1 Tax=Pontimicrobium sp. SW4 TaxID=3153519 RepID=A0AAU7BTM9_9FLAO